MSDLTRRIGELSPEKRALLARHLRERHESVGSAGVAPAAEPPAAVAPVSTVPAGWSASPAMLSAEAFRALLAGRAAGLPEARALIGTEESLDYGELDRRAGLWARRLRRLGVAAEVRVAVCARSSPAAAAAILGVLRAGGACVPLDAEMPEERLASLLEDAAPALLITAGQLAGRLPSARVLPLAVQEDLHEVAPDETWDDSEEGSLALVLYGAAPGVPRGVMVSRRALAHRLASLEERIGCGAGDFSLADPGSVAGGGVTGALWPLARGAAVGVLGREEARTAAGAGERIDFSLFFFTGDGSSAAEDKYRLVLESARFADRNGFAAIWTPERHFHPFGGLYPNPSVISAALAMITERLRIRAGSVVLPLHDPARVAEEWSVVDNLSRGRAGVAFASGWHPDDFFFSPEAYPDRRERTWEAIATLQRLWAGGTAVGRSGTGKEIEIRVFPRPLQRRLPVWITSGGSPETFVKAGELGAHLLTNLLGQSLEQVEERIDLYRNSLARHGHDPQAGRVTLMMHTFLGEDLDTVRERVRGPFCAYLKNFAGLLENLARSLGSGLGLASLTEQDREVLLAHAFERYSHTSALFGTPETCLPIVERLRRIGVDEVACLLDFGLDEDVVLEGLRHLERLRRLADESGRAATALEGARPSLLRCSPGTARRLADAGEPPAAGTRIVIEGDLAEPLVAELERALQPARLFVLQGDPDAAGWGLVRELGTDGSRPLPGCGACLLDERLEPVPDGEPADLYLAGEGLARGILGRPAATAEAFLPDPFDQAGGGRMLRTGRRARFLSDGSLEIEPQAVAGEGVAS